MQFPFQRTRHPCVHACISDFVASLGRNVAGRGLRVLLMCGTDGWRWVPAVQSGAQDTQEGRSRTVEDNKMNEQKDSLFGDPVLLAVEGETFDTVMAAIQSNSAAKSFVAVVLART